MHVSPLFISRWGSDRQGFNSNLFQSNLIKYKVSIKVLPNLLKFLLKFKRLVTPSNIILTKFYHLNLTT